jgi:hypothetical protein
MTSSGTSKKGSSVRWRGRVLAIVVLVVVCAIVAGCSSGSGVPSGSAHPAATQQIGGTGTYGTATQDESYSTVTAPTEDTTDQETTPETGTTDQGLSQNDWTQICADGGCNPSTGSPTFENGGGLALPEGGD